MNPICPALVATEINRSDGNDKHCSVHMNHHVFSSPKSLIGVQYSSRVKRMIHTIAQKRNGEHLMIRAVGVNKVSRLHLCQSHLCRGVITPKSTEVIHESASSSTYTHTLWLRSADCAQHIYCDNQCKSTGRAVKLLWVHEDADSDFSVSLK